MKSTSLLPSTSAPPLAAFVGAVATGAAIASVVGPPPHRRYPPPRAGYIYVVQEGQGAPRAVRAEETSFIIRRITVASYRTAEGGTVLFEVQVGRRRWPPPRGRQEMGGWAVEGGESAPRLQKLCPCVPLSEPASEQRLSRSGCET